MLISSVVPFDTTTFRSKHNSLELLLKRFLERFATVAFPAAKHIMKSIKLEALRKESPLNMYQF